MLQRIRNRAKEQKGFTLIELLVVVIIIGLLAAIAIPAFLGQRDKANDAAAKSLVRNAQTALEAAYADTQDYADITPAMLQAIEPNIAFGAAGVDDAALNQVGVTVAADGYVLTSTSNSDVTFTLTKDTDLTPAVTRTKAGGGSTCDVTGPTKSCW